MIVVVGAGIAGLSVAWELVRRGAEVAVLEATTIASGASGVATSYLEPRPGDTPLRRVEQQAVREWPAYAGAVETASGLDVEFHSDGQLRVTLAQNLARFERDMAARDNQGFPVRMLSGEAARAMEPALGEAIVAGAFLDDVCWVTGHKVCAALARAIRYGGGRILEHRPVIAINQAPEGDLRIVAADETFHPDKLVLCCGGSAASVAGLPEDFPQSRVVRGVNLIVDQSGLSRPVNRLIKHHRGNLCPRADGQLIVGTTYEPDVTSLDPDAEVIEKLYTNAQPILPVLRNLPLIKVTAGLRSKVGDGLLRLGRSQIQPSIYYSLSHAGAGFLRAPVVGREFAGYVLDGALGEFTGTIIA